tara:strand:- start:1317 stop:1877 length:561 start_codon:yes stop_codon:yes gene_type:complete
MFEDFTPFIIALVVIFSFMICIAIWNSINAPQAPEKAPSIEPGPSRTREILARFSEFYMNLNPEGEMIFDIDLLPDPKQHIIHALYVGFDESENDDEKSAIERGLRAIVTFQERVGELPIRKEMSEIEKNLTIPNSEEENVINTLDSSNVNIISEEEFQRFSVLRDQELETHFQHLKIQTAEEQNL